MPPNETTIKTFRRHVRRGTVVVELRLRMYEGRRYYVISSHKEVTTKNRELLIVYGFDPDDIPKKHEAETTAKRDATMLRQTDFKLQQAEQSRLQ